MSSQPLQRVQYRDVDAQDPTTVMDGETVHFETVRDMEDYLVPAARVDRSSTRSWGVLEGLEVTASLGQAEVVIKPGVGVDSTGNLVVLAANGRAIVDRDAHPTDPRGVVTVAVPQSGVAVPTTGLEGRLLLTLTWREVMGGTSTRPLLVHAPWVRLQSAGVVSPGAHVVAGTVVVEGGKVRELTGVDRVMSAVTSERVLLPSRKTVGGPTPTVGGQPTLLGELSTTEKATVELAATTPTGTSRRVFLSGNLEGGQVTLGNGSGVAIGFADAAPARPLHVEGNAEVHTGGSGAGYSFSDRRLSVTDQRSTLTGTPAKGERWLWYADGGRARLWSGTDRLSVDLTTPGGGLDVARQMRVRRGAGESAAGVWFTHDNNDRAFVGTRGNDEVGLFGPGTTQSGVALNVTTGKVTVDNSLDVNGQCAAQSFANVSDARLKSDVDVIDRPLEQLEELRGVTFNWKSGGASIGVLAQEVAEVFPDLVTTTGNEHLAVEYSGLVAVLIEAVKSLSEENRLVRERLDALEGG